MPNPENDNTEEQDPSSLKELLDHLVESTEDETSITIGDLLDSLDSRSHGPMLLLPALVAVSPIGMIPGMSFVTGSLILLIALQMMLFSKRPWIPKRLSQVEFDQSKLQTTQDRLTPWFQWIEKFTGERLDFLTRDWMTYPIALVSIALAITFYPLALVPFGVFFPGIAVCCFGLGMTSRDGLLVIMGYALTLGAFSLLIYAWPF